MQSDPAQPLAVPEQVSAKLVLELSQALVSSLDIHDILGLVVRRLAHAVGFERASLVLVPEGSGQAFVVVTSDNEQLQNLPVQLANYPEIERVLETQEPLVVADIAHHAVYGRIRDRVQHLAGRSLCVVPVVWQGQSLGVFFLRGSSRQETLSAQALEHLRILANATAIALRNAQVVQSLRDQLRERRRTADELSVPSSMDNDQRHTLIAELAGTAAHELNQPLTSLLAFTELLLRRFGAGSHEHGLVSTMAREVARIADTVRKMGDIRRYETKAYVGGQRILDLDLASTAELPSDPTIPHATMAEMQEAAELRLQLAQAQKLATLGELTASMLHELNNPLTGISVYARFLLERYEQGVMDELTGERLRRISENAERVLRMTRDVTAFSRPSERLPVAVSLNDSLKQSAAFCEHLMSRSNVSLHFELADALPPVRAVASQLHQVFINLITNACQAMNGKPGMLTLRTMTSSLEATPRVIAQISDDGPGISPEVVERIFEPFFSTKGPGEGTGLGLSIVRSIVELHGGAVAVASDLGHGTTFTVSFPSAL